jgi:hypothetical protein
MARTLTEIQEELENRVMRLYEEWPERDACRPPARPFAFFVWLGAHHSYLTASGAWGSRGAYQHISALVMRWERVYSELEGST